MDFSYRNALNALITGSVNGSLGLDGLIIIINAGTFTQKSYTNHADGTPMGITADTTIDGSEMCRYHLRYKHYYA